MVFAGEYDVASKEQLRSDLDRLAAVQHLVLDFSEVTYVDSTVVLELLRLHLRRSQAQGGSETLVVGAGNVQKVLHTFGLQKVFHVVSSVGEVLDGDAIADTRYAAPGAILSYSV